jgi:hypothetical protein
MDNKTADRKKKGGRKNFPNALANNPPGRRSGDAAARLIAVLDSHDELCAALRAAGRWMMRRAASKRDLQALDKLRNVLIQADDVSGVLRRHAANGSSEHAPSCSSVHVPRVLVMSAKRISRNRCASR